jgi:CheY-like chemotaxis protein
MARILLIDDRRISMDRAHAVLRGDGHDLIEATDVLAGLHRAVEDSPDCVVVDLDLNGLDGIELCRKLMQSQSTRGVPVVVWGMAKVESVHAIAREAGAFAYVDRANTPGALRGVVRRALGETRDGSGDVRSPGRRVVRPLRT